ILYAIDDLNEIEGKWYFKPEYLESFRKNAYGWVNWNWLANQRFSSMNTLGFQRLSKSAEFLLDMNPFDETRRLNHDDHHSDILTFRQQNLWRLSEAHLLEFGMEANRFHGKYFYDEIRFDRLRIPQGGAIFDTLYLNTKISGHTLSGYLQDTWTISKRLDFLLGFRVSEQSFASMPQFAPRSALKISFSDHLNLKLAYGWYYQPDNFYKLKTYLGETKLASEPEKCIHYVGGLSFAQENPTGVALTFDFDAYFKDYVRLNDDFQFDIHDRHGDAGVIDIPFNARRGVSKGADFFIRGEFANDNLLSLAYSFSQNRVTDHLGRIVPRNFDRTHSINVNSVFKLTRALTISALWRFHSGNPFTPATIQVFGDSTWFNS
ncbi:MAG: TonB-dependent receptor plug domain-containing protein, partial [bacterium]